MNKEIFIEELKNDGYVASYDSYEFDKIFEFIIKNANNFN